MRTFAFQGLRYTSAAGDDRGLFAAPPYDQIPDTAAADYHALSPYHFTRLTLPSGQGEERYENARELHELWRAERLVSPDPEPSLYPYRIHLEGGGARLGLCALVGLEPPESGVIRPHEETLAKPLADRLALLEATEVDLEPILLVADDEGALDELLADDVRKAAPLVVHTDASHNEHELYRLTGRERIDTYRELLASVWGAIADGHHRYKVARRFAEKYDVTEGAAAAKLAVITSVDSEGLTIDPIHRALTDAVDLAPAGDLVADRRRITAKSGDEIARRVAVAGPSGIGVWEAGEVPEIWTFDADGDSPPGRGRRALAVELLHERLFPRLGVSPGAATDGTVIFRSDPNALFESQRQGEVAVSFWLPPMDPSDFAAAVETGRMLPPKSTRFLPKVASGLVWCAHDSELLGASS